MNVDFTPGSPISKEVASFSSDSSPQSYSQVIDNFISFQSYILPFTQILIAATEKLFTGTFKVLSFGLRCFSAIDVIVHRLIYAPTFDPTHPSFKKLIDQLETQVPLLQKRIDELEHKFSKDHSMTADSAELRALSDEIFRTFWQLNTYTTALEKRVHPFPIQAQLTQVRDAFRKLDDQLDDFCLEKGKSILKNFKEIVIFFNKAGNKLREEIREELFKTCRNLESVLYPRLYNLENSNKLTISECNDFSAKLYSIKNIINDVKNTSKFTPLKLSNIGNSCYMDSVLESILCIDYIRKEFNRSPEKYKKTIDKETVAIQQEIVRFIDSQQYVTEGEQLSQMNLVLYLRKEGPSLHRLREAFFKANQAVLEMDELTSQHDAAYIMEILIDLLLPGCQYYSHEYSTTDALPGLVMRAHGDDVANALLQVPLRNKEQYQDLATLVRLTIGKRKEKEKDPQSQREFDPKDGSVIPGKEDSAALVCMDKPIKVEEYVHWDRLTKLPPVLTIQFKRFAWNKDKGKKSKDLKPVRLPEDGILDLSKYYDAPEGEPKGARYKIKSMVRHLGSQSNSGHYVAEVEISGKYYHCNDIDPNGYKEISKQDFLDYTDPYLLFLERILDE